MTAFEAGCIIYAPEIRNGTCPERRLTALKLGPAPVKSKSKKLSFLKGILNGFESYFASLYLKFASVMSNGPGGGGVLARLATNLMVTSLKGV